MGPAPRGGRGVSRPRPAHQAGNDSVRQSAEAGLAAGRSRDFGSIIMALSVPGLLIAD